MLGWQTAGGEGFGYGGEGFGCSGEGLGYGGEGLSCGGEGLGCGGEGLRGAGEGMDEGDGEGVKAETRYVSGLVLVLVLVLPLAFPRHLLEAICCVGAVEEVAGDRAGETESVGAVDAELVGAACERIQLDVCRSVWVCLQYLVVCVRRFALLEIHFLSWSFVVVGR